MSIKRKTVSLRKRSFILLEQQKKEPIRLLLVFIFQFVFDYSPCLLLRPWRILRTSERAL